MARKVLAIFVTKKRELLVLPKLFLLFHCELLFKGGAIYSSARQFVHECAEGTNDQSKSPAI